MTNSDATLLVTRVLLRYPSEASKHPETQQATLRVWSEELVRRHGDVPFEIMLDWVHQYLATRSSDFPPSLDALCAGIDERRRASGNREHRERFLLEQDEFPEEVRHENLRRFGEMLRALCPGKGMKA